MKEFLKKVWKGIKREFMMLLISTWYVWFAIIIATIVGLISNWNISVWVFFGIVFIFILYIWLRQLWWWVTKTGDYKHRKK